MKIKHARHLPKGFTLVELLVVIAIIAGLAAMSYGPIMKKLREGEQAKAITKGKNLSVALFGYAAKNDGLFPEGDDVYEAFQELIDTEAVDDEEIFWVKENSATGTVVNKKPDNDGEVETGECSWGYVAGLTNTSKTNTPLIFDSSAKAGSFDTAVWGGQAIVVKINGSVSAMKIDYQGKPTNDDGTSKEGPILEQRGNTEADIFSEQYLPKNTEVLVPQG